MRNMLTALAVALSLSVAPLVAGAPAAAAEDTMTAHPVGPKCLDNGKTLLKVRVMNHHRAKTNAVWWKGEVVGEVGPPFEFGETGIPPMTYFTIRYKYDDRISIEVRRGAGGRILASGLYSPLDCPVQRGAK